MLDLDRPGGFLSGVLNPDDLRSYFGVLWGPLGEKLEDLQEMMDVCTALITS